MILSKLLPLALLCFLQFQGAVASDNLVLAFGSTGKNCNANQEYAILDLEKAIGVLHGFADEEDDESKWITVHGSDVDESDEKHMDEKREELCAAITANSNGNAYGACGGSGRALTQEEEALAALQGERRLPTNCFLCWLECIVVEPDPEDEVFCSCVGPCFGLRRNLRGNRKLQTQDPELIRASAATLCHSGDFDVPCLDCDNIHVKLL